MIWIIALITFAWTGGFNSSLAPLPSVQPQRQMASPSDLSQSCKLIDEIPGFQHDDESVESTEKKRLTALWAQEYTGSDLLREEMVAAGLSLRPGTVGVWDSTPYDHGKKVCNLIAGPTAASVVPSPEAINYVEVSANEGSVSYLDEARSCLEKKNCPNYINNSMHWPVADVPFAAVKALKSQSLFVLIAGNNFNSFHLDVDELKVKAARDFGSLVIGSSDPFGFPSYFSESHEVVSVLAPSNAELLTYDSANVPRSFGGTSGATPEVTGALTAFTTITGYPLSGLEAKNLLTKTAIPAISNYFSPQVHGRGLLNTYRIGAVAFRIRENCLKKGASCVRALLAKPSTYRFPKSDLSQEWKAFPGCQSGAMIVSEKSEFKDSCEGRQALKKIRQSIFLNPDQPEVWQGLGCIYQRQGYLANAEYYQWQSLWQKGQPDWKVISEDLAKVPPLRRLNLAQIENPLAVELLLQMIQQGELVKDVAIKVLSDERWAKHPRFADLVRALRGSGEANQKLVESLLRESSK
jgi:hypothetical protein